MSKIDCFSKGALDFFAVSVGGILPSFKIIKIFHTYFTLNLDKRRQRCYNIAEMRE